MVLLAGDIPSTSTAIPTPTLIPRPKPRLKAASALPLHRKPTVRVKIYDSKTSIGKPVPPLTPIVGSDVR